MVCVFVLARFYILLDNSVQPLLQLLGSKHVAVGKLLPMQARKQSTRLITAFFSLKICIFLVGFQEKVSEHRSLVCNFPIA